MTISHYTRRSAFERGLIVPRGSSSSLVRGTSYAYTQETNMICDLSVI